MGKRGKEKRKKRRTRKDEVENSCTIPIDESEKPRRTYNFNRIPFASQKEANIARFIFDKNIETNTDELVKLTGLVYDHKILADNEAEIRFARLLMKNWIRFEYSKKIETKRIIKDKNKPETPDTTANGNDAVVEPNTREIDFWLPDGPILVPLCTWPVQAFEIKGGKLNMNNHRQQRELRDANHKTFIVLPEFTAVYEKYGLLEPISTRNRRARGVYQKPECLLKNIVPKNESSLKHKLAKTLLDNNVEFEYVEDDRNCPPGKHCHRSIFFLTPPAKGFWCGAMTQAIILIEGEITLDDIERWEEVSETFNTFPAIWNFVYFWQRHGFLRPKK